MLFHIVDAETWSVAARVGEYRPASLDTEGFVHCSYAWQVAATANRYYAEAQGQCVVELDPARLRAPLRVEDSSGTGEAFPHVYGPIRTAAAVAVHQLVRDESGAWAFPRAGMGRAGGDHGALE